MRVTILTNQGQTIFEAGKVAKSIALDPWDERAFGLGVSGGDSMLRLMLELDQRQERVNVMASYNELVYLRDVLNRIIRDL